MPNKKDIDDDDSVKVYEKVERIPVLREGVQSKPSEFLTFTEYGNPQNRCVGDP